MPGRYWGWQAYPATVNANWPNVWPNVLIAVIYEGKIIGVVIRD